MRRIKIIIKSTDDSTEELRYAAMLRRDLYAHSPVEIDPDNRLHGTRRDSNGRAYFEFATDYPEEVRRIINQFGYKEQVELTECDDVAGEACANCGNIVGGPIPSVCPTCGFRDISQCPHCSTDVSRQAYVPDAGNLFRCPNCKLRVRLCFNNPLLKADGTYSEPLVIVKVPQGTP